MPTIKNIFFIISLSLNIFLLYIVLDTAVTTTYMEVSIKDQQKHLNLCKILLNEFKDKIVFHQLLEMIKKDNFDVFDKNTDSEDTSELVINGISFQYSKTNHHIKFIDIPNIGTSNNNILNK